MLNTTKKIRRKYSGLYFEFPSNTLESHAYKNTDFYTTDDYLDGKRTEKTLLVTDLDKKGRVLNPKAPCVVTLIDDQYTADVNKNKKSRKFNVKSDVLKLRDITRHKFFIYVTQQRALEKAREQHLHSIMYKQTQRFLKMSSNQLNTLKNELFSSMIAENKKVDSFLQFNISEEVKKHMTIHQRLSIEVTDAHHKFLFLLKLLNYFSVNKEGISVLGLTNNLDTSDLLVLKSDLRLENINSSQTEKLKEYVATYVKPYLSEQTYLNMEFWIEGYESTRLRLFDYYKQFTTLAINYHIFQTINSKFIKGHNCRLVKPIPRNTPQHFVNRTQYLQNKTSQLLQASEKQHTKGSISLHIKGLAPVVLKKIWQEENCEKAMEKSNEINTLEEMHSVLMQLLGKLDDFGAGVCVEKEKEIRRLIANEREMSRKVLIKVNRFQNWIDHYKKHVNMNI